MRFFHNVETLEQLKAEYRRLTKLHHPDLGGDLETMKQINAEHDELFEVLKARQNAKADADSTGRTYRTTETAEEFRTILEKLIVIDGIEIELCGSWLWIGGDTKPHKDELKAAGCRWSRNKGKWYWHHAEEGKRWHRGKSSMNEIRSKYGSQHIDRKNGLHLVPQA